MNKTSPNAVEWFEIPTADFSKSIPFYNRVLGLSLEAKEFGPHRVAVFPHEDPGPGGCLMQGPGMVPSGAGSVVYLPTANIDCAIEQVEAAGGRITVPRTPIGADIGFFARFLDPEGNLVGLCGLGRDPSREVPS
jgi:predicted enzyme related to lactoylglutathione lyase